LRSFFPTAFNPFLPIFPVPIIALSPCNAGSYGDSEHFRKQFVSRLVWSLHSHDLIAESLLEISSKNVLDQTVEEATMLTVLCPRCQQTFEFNPAKIWSSPGAITNLTGGTRVVIQCEHCKQWLTVALSVTKLDDKPNSGQ
jgi:hypothetical protein